jgi:peptidoglycan/LPS O-acetylase OafA/YrhL
MDTFLSTGQGDAQAARTPTGKSTGGLGGLLPERLPSLTGLRFVAAFMVFLYHSSLRAPYLRLIGDNKTAGDWFTLAQPTGGLGVTFFFVLSGFVLTWSARKGDTSRAFWRRRFVKIYPNYVVTWLLAMILFAAASTPAWKALLNLFMLQVWVPEFNTHFSVDSPSWSLGAEAVFYACFPLLLMLAQRTSPDRLKYWIAGTIAGVIAAPLVAYLAFSSTPAVAVGAASEIQYYLVYVNPIIRVFDFALGIFLAQAVLTGRWRNVGMIWSGLLLIGTIVLAEFVPFLYGQRAVAIIPIAMLIAAAAMRDSQGGFTLFRNRVMVWLGNISFAFYLLHFIVLRAGRSILGTQLFSTPVAVGVLVVELLVSVALSGLLYTLVEQPMVRRWSRRRTAAAAPATVAG